MAGRYLIALGSNVRHVRFGAPEAVVRAALAQLGGADLTLLAAAPLMRSRPLGPSRRRYANSAAMIASDLAPRAMLERLQAIEHAFGRRRRGQRWSARVLDLDVVLWSGGNWRDPVLKIPHRRFRDRGFVLAPAARIAPNWRDPMTRLTLSQLAARLTRPRPLPIAPAWSGP